MLPHFLVKRYEAPSQKHWQGRADGPRLHHLIRCVDVTKALKDTKKAVALIGFACDTGVVRNQGRAGAHLGPLAIRRAAANMAIHRMTRTHIIDAGTITCGDGNLEESQKALSALIALVIEKGFVPVILGGGHEVAFASYLGLRETKQHKSLQIINFDAHFDLRPLLEGNIGSSGTPFLQIATAQKDAKAPFAYTCIGVQEASNTQALFETARALKVKTLLASKVHEKGAAYLSKSTRKLVPKKGTIYLSLCMDVFSASHAPGVSAPQALGLLPQQILPSIELLARSGKVALFDIAELCPPHDTNSITAKLAAHCLVTFCEAFESAN